MIRDEIGPIAKQTAQRIADTNGRIGNLSTPLTQSRRSAGRPVRNRRQPKATPPSLGNRCRTCGTGIDPAWKYCEPCRAIHETEKLEVMGERSHETLARLRSEGTDPAHGGQAARKRGNSSRDQNAASRQWERDNPMPPDSVYLEEIVPHLDRVTVPQIANATGLSSGYASMIRRGIKIPHPRHWKALKELIESPATTGSVTGLGYDPHHETTRMEF